MADLRHRPAVVPSNPRRTVWTALRRLALIAGLSLVLVPRAPLPAQDADQRVVPNAGAQRPARVGLPIRAAAAEFREEVAKPAPPDVPAGLTLPGGFQPEQMVSPGGLSSTLNLLIMMTVVSLAPSILMMTTCFIRFIVVLGLLRQALGTQQLPPNQVLIALSLFLTFMVMGPIWQQSYERGILPYTQPAAGQPAPSLADTFQNTVLPLRRYMSEQVERTGNSDSIWMFIEYQRPPLDTEAGRNYRSPETYDEVPLTALVPAFMLAELKTAFIIGFQLYLPFLVIDMVVASVLMSMGMMMLPPTLVSFPFKLLLFVLIDGWALTVGMLLESVRPFL